MLSVILNILLCSSLLIAVYYLFLEKERMYRFNRFYLLFSLVFSYSVPLVTITRKVSLPAGNSQPVFTDTAQQIVNLSRQKENFDWIMLSEIIYGIIALVCLVKLIVSIIALKRLKGRTVYYRKYQLFITEKKLSPFSFWNTIYMGEHYLVDNEVDQRIFLHEKSHLDQKHTLDRVLIELIKIITWFNPALYFYKKAMVTNHEFLADEAVLESNFSIKDYQNLILKEITGNQGPELTHSFNFNNTKKRFIMMTTKKTKLTGIKKLASIPLLILAFGLFVQKTYAYNNEADKRNADIEKSDKVTRTLIKENTEKEKHIIRKVISDTIRPVKKNTPKKVKKQNLGAPSTPPASGTSTSTPANPGAPAQMSKSFKQADFPEGLNEFRSRVAKNFNAGILKGNEGLLRSTALISIKADGTLDKVTAEGDNKTFNDEIVRTIKKVTENVKWDPATENGKPISTAFKLPIAMSFDNSKK